MSNEDVEYLETIKKTSTLYIEKVSAKNDLLKDRVNSSEDELDE